MSDYSVSSVSDATYDPSTISSSPPPSSASAATAVATPPAASDRIDEASKSDSPTLASAAMTMGSPGAAASPAAPPASKGTQVAAVPSVTQASSASAKSAGTSPPGGPPLSPERAKTLDAWAAKNASPGFFSGVFSGSGSSRVANALNGQDPSLGKLSPAEQQHLLDRSLDQWQHSGDSASISALGDALQGKGALSDLASATFAKHAADVTAAAGPKSDMYTSGVASTTRNVAGALATSAANDATSTAALGKTIRGLGANGAGAFADAVTMGSSSQSPGSGEPSPLARSLDAINAGPNDAIATSFTSHALASAKDWNFQTSMATESGLAPTGASDAAAPMGTALARMAHPNDRAAEARDASRFAGLIGGKQGSKLLTADVGNDTVSTTDRFRALGALAAHPEITEQSLEHQGGSPWSNPTLATELAKSPATAMLRTSGDASVALPGEELDRTVAAAMPGAKASDVSAVTKSIRDAADGQTPKVAVLPVQVSTDARGPVQVSLFRVDNDGQEKYVDNQGRTYGSFQQWKSENALPSGNMTYPANGHLTADAQGNANLQSGNTPATPDTLGKKALAAADNVALVGGVAAGVAVMAGGGWIPATALGAASLWSAGRQGQHLADMASHGQSIDPASSSEARSAWLGVLANGAVGVGSGLKAVGAVSGLAEGGGAFASTTSAFDAAGAGLSTIAGANQANDDLRNWNSLTPQQKLMAGVNLGFTVASAGAAGRQFYAGRTAPAEPAAAAPAAEAAPNAAPEPAPKMVPQQVQQAQARDLRGAPAQATVNAYAKAVNSNKPWTWNDIPGGGQLTAGQRSAVKKAAVEQRLVPNVPVDPATKNADFSGHVITTKQLPQSMWKATDSQQFKYLDSQLPGGVRPPGTTWHHTQTPGVMELVPFGVHNMTNHSGGRASGSWADAPR